MAIDFPSSPTNGQTYTSGGTTWVYDSSVPAWNLQNTVISGPTGPTGPTGPAGTAFVGYDHEIHVSNVDGNDTTGNGDLLNPVQTITKAVTLVSGSRFTIIVHPGSTYSESVTLTAKTIIKAAEGPAYSDGPFINGTITIPAAATNSQISGISITTLTISETAAATIFNCNVTTFNKTSSGTVNIFGGSFGGTTSVTGTGLIRFSEMLNLFNLTNNNAASTVSINTCKVLFNPINTAGSMFIGACGIFGSGTYTVTSSGNSITILNSLVFNSVGSALRPISISAGTYTIGNNQMDYANSVFTGATASTNPQHFGVINANSYVTRGGSSSQYVKGDGSLESLTPVTKTADFTVAATESYLINNKSGSACVVTLPAAASFVGRKIVFTNYQAQTIDSASSNVVPIAGGSPGTSIVGATAGNWAAIISDGTNWLIVERG